MKLLSILAAFLLTIPAVYSWGWETHSFFCEHIYNSNIELNKRLDRDEFLRGCLAPDKEYKDSRNHYCYVAKQCKVIDVNRTNAGELPYFTDFQECMEDNYFDCPAMENFEEALNNATISNFSFYVGVAAHYFTDSYVPVHQTMGEDYFKCHLPFESKVDNKLEKGEKFWTITQPCKFYFPCSNERNVTRKCSNSYYAEISYSYEDVIEVLEKTDSAVGKNLGIKEGDYSHLLKTKPTAWITLILDKILELLRRVL